MQLKFGIKFFIITLLSIQLYISADFQELKKLESAFKSESAEFLENISKNSQRYPLLSEAEINLIDTGSAVVGVVFITGVGLVVHVVSPTQGFQQFLLDTGLAAGGLVLAASLAEKYKSVKHRERFNNILPQIFEKFVKDAFKSVNFSSSDILIRQMLPGEERRKGYADCVALADKNTNTIAYNHAYFLKIIGDGQDPEVLRNFFQYLRYVAAHEAGHILPESKAPKYPSAHPGGIHKQEEQRADFFAMKFLCNSQNMGNLRENSEFKFVSKKEAVQGVTYTEWKEWRYEMMDKCRLNPETNKYEFNISE